MTEMYINLAELRYSFKRAMSIAGPAVYENWNIIALLADRGLSERLYTTLLKERPSVLVALTELIYNVSSQVFSTKLKKRLKKTDLKLLTTIKGSRDKKCELLSKRYYRKSVIPVICEAALQYLEHGGDKGHGKESVK